MARITVEDCLTRENNRFALVQLASKRTKQLLGGARTLTTEAKGNKAVVTALREIAQGAVRFMTPEDEAVMREREERMKELGLDTPVASPTSAADDLFILPSTTTKETNGARLLADDDDEGDDEDMPIDEDDSDDSDDEEGEGEKKPAPEGDLDS